MLVAKLERDEHFPGPNVKYEVPVKILYFCKEDNVGDSGPLADVNSISH